MGGLFFVGGATCMYASGVENSPKVDDAIVQQNGRTVAVTVNDAMGPVIGANVLVKGTTIGSITDIDGHATIDNVPNNATLVISYIGYTTQEIALQNNQRTLTVTLSEDSETLDEVVVVGYGTQAKKDITGSVAVVERDAISSQPVSSFAEALQGRAAGVYVSSGGGPAGDTTIRIRGVGSVNGSDPLIIVDGIQGVNINSVNPNDIESMQVLKDAAATAVYGARAANGVIIVTTKQGNKDSKVTVSYNGYVGWSQFATSGYDVVGAFDFMDAVGYGFENMVKYNGADPSGLTHNEFGAYDPTKGKAEHYGLSMPDFVVPVGFSEADMVAKYGTDWMKAYSNASPDNAFVRSAYKQKLLDGYSEAEAKKGTNWFDEVSRKGLVTNHELSIQGGGAKGMYSLGIGYMNREGTLKNSGMERYTIRMNSSFSPTKHVTMGINSNINVMKTTGEQGSQGDSSIFGQTYTTQTWIPAYNVAGDFAGTAITNSGRNATPVASVQNAKNDWNRNARINAAVFLEIKDPWLKGLTLKTQFSTGLSGSWSATMSERTNYWNKEGSSVNTFSESGSWSFNWQWTNTATYKVTIADAHDLTFMVGTEAIKEGIGRNISGSRTGYIFENDPNTWTLSNGATSNISNSGGMGSKVTMFGYFGRADYSYKGKYLATFTIRRDASSKFSSKNRWGTFPSASLGWRFSDEKFMDFSNGWLDDAKLRVGYGTTGNSNIGSYNYAFQYATGSGYMYAMDGSNANGATGYALSNLGDTNAKWETTKMFNVGLDLTLFRNLTTTFDFYVKTTSDMLTSAPWSAQVGTATKPNVNIGNMRNTGWDWSISWRQRTGDWNYNLSFNLSQYKNKVTKLPAGDIYSSTRLSDVNKTTVGQPVGMFYGYVVDGIYKSEEDVLNYPSLPFGVTDASSLNAKSFVGRYKIKDVSGDGKITGADKTIIGNPHPDFTGGFNASVTWKNFDLSTYLYFSLGNDIFAMYQYYTLFGSLNSNVTYTRLNNSWDPVTNPNGKYPMWLGVGKDGTEAKDQANSQYVQDGSYLRMQTLTLGYTLPTKLVKKINLSKVRFYLQASNVFTITGYEGLDPEVRSGSDLSKGVDYGSYGMPRQFIFGVNVNF